MLCRAQCWNIGGFTLQLRHSSRIEGASCNQVHCSLALSGKQDIQIDVLL